MRKAVSFPSRCHRVWEPTQASQVGKDSDQLDRGQEKATRMTRNPENMGCKERLKVWWWLKATAKENWGGIWQSGYLQRSEKHLFMSTDDKGRRISNKRDLGLEFRGKKILVIKAMKHWNTLPREAVEFRLSVEIFKNTSGRCLNVGIVPIRKVERQTKCSSEIQDPEMQPMFYAFFVAIVFMAWE